MAAVGILLISLRLALVAQAFLTGSQSQPASSIYVSPAPQAAAGSPSVPVPWPEFPHSGPRAARSSVINGTSTLAESWETGASASDVLAYYREQMLARGWQDVTEETYNIRPELHQGLSEGGQEQYAKLYRKIADSTLVMTSTRQTMHLQALPSATRPENVSVEIYAVGAPSFKEFAQSLRSAFDPNAGQPVEAIQQSGGQLYRTVLAARDQSSAEAFHQELATLKAEGWRAVITLPSQKGRPGHFAWLIKGQAYMALSASPSGQGRCCLSRTQVTPDSAKAGH